MKKFAKVLAVAIGCIVAGAALAASSADQNADNSQKSAISRTQNLEQLLQQVKNEQNAAVAKNRERERRFRQELDKQQAILARAEAEKKNVSERGDKLQATFNANEQKLDKLSGELQTQLGNLGQVFGVVRQTAANMKGIVDSSLISAQYRDRAQFLSRMANANSLPSIDELHKLWYMMLQQAAAEGKVVSFPTQITRADGTQFKTNVVRVGGFTAVHGSDYLNYLPETGQLVVYAVQPSDKDAQSRAQNLYNAKSGIQKMALDPSRGQFLSLLLRSHKTFKQRLDDGGSVGYTIVVLFIIGILVAIERIIALTIAQSKVKKQLKTNTPDPNNALGRVMMVYSENPNDDVQTLELKLDEAILKEQPALEARLGLIKLIAAVGPLLGLLGTVIGMIETFQVITTFGSADPRLMAKGISVALVTTVEGLVTAIPLVLLHAYISSKSGNVIQVLEEQSAGIIAAQAEKKS